MDTLKTIRLNETMRDLLLAVDKRLDIEKAENGNSYIMAGLHGDIKAALSNEYFEKCPRCSKPSGRDYDGQRYCYDNVCGWVGGY